MLFLLHKACLGMWLSKRERAAWREETGEGERRGRYSCKTRLIQLKEKIIHNRNFYAWESAWWQNVPWFKYLSVLTENTVDLMRKHLCWLMHAWITPPPQLPRAKMSCGWVDDRWPPSSSHSVCGGVTFMCPRSAHGSFLSFSACSSGYKFTHTPSLVWKWFVIFGLNKLCSCTVNTGPQDKVRTPKSPHSIRWAPVSCVVLMFHSLVHSPGVWPSLCRMMHVSSRTAESSPSPRPSLVVSFRILEWSKCTKGGGGVGGGT